jgi:transglutaminase-like putative cysteine protease
VTDGSQTSTSSGQDAPALPAKRIDWAAVRRAVLQVEYSLRYEYPGPIHDVRQLLMLVPPDHRGTQTLLWHEVRTQPVARPRYTEDRFGNRLCHLAMAEALNGLELGVALRVELLKAAPPPMLPGDEALYLSPSPLAESWPALEREAAVLAAAHTEPEALAEAIMQWSHARLTYAFGITGVSTTARDADELGAGVCQDYAHLMIAACRQAGLPARYVSGHLLDEGVMHAWVEVLLPKPSDGARPNVEKRWQPFDPTHARRAHMPYITIAVGRDFVDVSPTRGSFRAPFTGQLAGVRKHSTIVQLEY